MSAAPETIHHVLTRLREVQGRLGITPLAAENGNALLADLLDSMGLVELLAILANDRGIRPEDIENAAGQRFTTVAALAVALDARNVNSSLSEPVPATPYPVRGTEHPFLTGVRAYLPH